MQAVDFENNHRAGIASLGESVVEVPVLLETGLLAALEEAAAERGLSAARVVRLLIRDFLSTSASQS